MKSSEIVVLDGRALDPKRSEDRVILAELSTAAIRLRNRGASVERIAQVLKVNEGALAALLDTAIQRLAGEDARSVRGRQQAMIHDLYDAMVPALDTSDPEVRSKVVTTIKGVLEYEGKLTGATAPERVRIGMDTETFTTRVEEDLRQIGIDPDFEPPMEEDDGSWANT